MTTIDELIKFLNRAKIEIGGAAEVMGYDLNNPIREFDIEMITKNPKQEEIRLYCSRTKRPYLSLRLKPTKTFREIMNRNNK